MRVKHSFFDRAAVLAAVSRGRLKAMIRIGGFIRTTAKRSIRKRKAVSKAGSPPSSHVGLLREQIYFSYDPASDSVVIGPALLTNSSRKSRPIGGATVPSVLEEGGKVEILDRIGSGHEVKRTVEIGPRPYMGPALAIGQESGKLEGAWKDVMQ